MTKDRILKRARLAQQRGRVGESMKLRILANEVATISEKRDASSPL
jgi:hypothetical protein